MCAFDYLVTTKDTVPRGLGAAGLTLILFVCLLKTRPTMIERYRPGGRRDLLSTEVCSNFASEPPARFRARTPRSRSPSPSPICPGTGTGRPSPIWPGTGTLPRPRPRFAEIGDQAVVLDYPKGVEGLARGLSHNSP